MSHPLNDIGSLISSSDGNASESSGAPSLITAAGTGDNTKVTGQVINRKSGVALAHSAVVATGWLAALTNAKTFSLAHEIAESSDGSNFDTAEVIEALAVKKTATSTTNFRGVDEHDVNLMGRKQYFRVNVTPDLNASGTDTALFFTVIVLGGWTQIPQ